ncbi:hypothetical protein [Pseudonocardia sp. GCM10023141]|uniref:hypothetical protein n=1 Tax=Pseudonocardia sp. GCM10023141 TaxID=3252653 RepID=UPI00361F81CE
MPEPDGTTVSVTCLNDGRAHAVFDAELAGSSSRGGGYYRAVCGHMVTPAPMVEPDGKPCPHCVEAYSERRDHQPRGLSQRLLRR